MTPIAVTTSNITANVMSSRRVTLGIVTPGTLTHCVVTAVTPAGGFSACRH